MNQPTLSLIPMYEAIAIGRSVTLDVLVKILPPAIDHPVDRPPLNLGFVLDRSGSMSGAKIDFARQAVAYAVEQLLPSDRLSLTLFDTHVKTAIPSTLATDKHKLLDTIRGIRTGSSTALHSGWVNGGLQVSQYLNPEHLNRVILLSDGLANVGETNPDAIANDVHGLMNREVTTTTLGVGADYDEDLLEAMAHSGDGNFFHIDSPDQLPEIFATELQGLAGTMGHSVELSLIPLQGTVIADVLNDVAKTEAGALKLPNLTVGSPINVVFRLRIPALTQSSHLLQVKLVWQAPQQTETQSLEATLSLQGVKPEQMSDFPANAEVTEQVALLMAARARQEAVQFADRGDWAGAVSTLQASSKNLAAMPASASISEELTAVQDLTSDFETGEKSIARKRARYQAYNLNRSRSSDYGKRRPKS
ncbi:MAG: VWA domain-containing protein [Leptolyngbya sp. SIO1D8]|nr:VWA domain-containing protein [Leptolyngbya sp. SIO1D8]